MFVLYLFTLDLHRCKGLNVPTFRKTAAPPTVHEEDRARCLSRTRWMPDRMPHAPTASRTPHGTPARARGEVTPDDTSFVPLAQRTATFPGARIRPALHPGRPRAPPSPRAGRHAQTHQQSSTIYPIRFVCGCALFVHGTRPECAGRRRQPSAAGRRICHVRARRSPTRQKVRTWGGRSPWIDRAPPPRRSSGTTPR
jgi:hypothetical protein